MPARSLAVLASGAVTLAWLTLATGFAAEAAAPSAPVDLGGERLPGGDASTDAAAPTDLDPGLWQATLAPDYTQYFTYERRIKDSRVHVGVLGAPQGASSDGIRVVAEVEDDGSTTTCGDEDDSAEYSVPQAVIGAALVVGDESGSTGDTCRGAGTIAIQVTRGYGSPTTDLPYVIKVVEEAPSAALPADAEPEDQPSYDVPEPVDASEVDGAASFEDAPELDARDGAVTVSTTMTEGTEVLWKVPLAWGDLPVVRVDVPWATGGDEETFSSSGPDLTLHLVDPLRARLRYVASGSEDSSTGQYRARPEDETADGTVLVASGFGVSQVNGRTPGDHWVSLAVAPPPEDRDPVDIPVEVTVQVAPGDEAEPAYNSAVLSQDDGAGPEGYDPSEPFLVADGVFAAVASGNPVVASDEDDAWLDGRRWAGLGIAALSIACLAGGVVRLRARR
ncbi:hypothetical protein ACFQ0K_07730 [Nocardioides caeni]|uniref:Uncharacterized protein n=1 Tax=Nocardioides caeni TaxID=574700 RepID=A0A4S8N0G5_9ACTN|nr:hypothetical protein [Nocardioides caeni]THV08982.1 hypothetical protein E9934_18010 [Nocardioides caeni]